MVIGALCRRLGLRQRVTATACVYCKRFYCANAYAATDPMLVIAACVYLAAKADETPVRIRPFCTETAKLFAEMGFDDFADDIHVLAEMEFYLLEELDCDLVVFHPYATLAALARAPDTPLDGNTLQMAWLVVNDMYRTELPLQYPPYVLAVASVYLALVLQPQSAQTLRAGLAARASPPAGSESPPPVPADDAVALLARLNVSLTAVAQVSQAMLAHYELCHRLYSASGALRDHASMFARLRRMYAARRDDLVLART